MFCSVEFFKRSPAAQLLPSCCLGCSLLVTLPVYATAPVQVQISTTTCWQRQAGKLASNRYTGTLVHWYTGTLDTATSQQLQHLTRWYSNTAERANFDNPCINSSHPQCRIIIIQQCERITNCYAAVRFVDTATGTV